MENFKTSDFMKRHQTKIDLLGYSFFCLASVLNILICFFVLGEVLAQVFPIDKGSSIYFDWIQPYFYPQNRFNIPCYLGALAAGGAYAVLIASNKKMMARFQGLTVSDAAKQYGVALISLGAATAIYFSSRFRSPVFVVAIAVLFLISQFSYLLPTSESLGKRARDFSFGLILLFVLALLRFGSGPFYLFAEYQDYPRTLKIGDQTAEIHDVINQRGLWGNHYIYASGAPEVSCPEGNVLHGLPAQETTKLSNAAPDRFYLNTTAGDLCVWGQVTHMDRQALTKAFPSKTNEIDQLWMKNGATYANLISDAFLAKNVPLYSAFREEIIYISHDLELYFHHHFQFLSPINEVMLHKPANMVSSLYGGSIYIYKSLLTLVGYSYENFLLIHFLLFSLYFIFLYFCLRPIFKSDTVFTVTLIASVVPYLALEYHVLVTGVGFSPFRHFFDVGIFCALWFLSRSSNRTAYVGLALCLVGSFIIDVNFGLIISASAIAATGARLLKDLVSPDVKTKRAIEIFLITVLSSAAGFVVGKHIVMPSPFEKGLVAGIWSFDIPRSVMVVFGVYISFLFVMCLRYWRTNSPKLTSVTFLSAYSMLVLAYWLKIPNYGHLYAILPTLLLTLLFIIDDLGEPRQTAQRIVGRIAVVCVCLLAFTFALRKCLISQNIYRDGFGQYVLYDWNFPNMHVKSTMQPEPMIKATELIKKYADAPGIYMISRYDHILSFLSGKYSMMPLFEMIGFTSNKIDYATATESLAQAKPSILFVDTGYNRNFDLDTHEFLNMQAPPTAFLSLEYTEHAALKAKKERRLFSLFEAIKDQYELVESTPLLSVYKRRN